MKTIKISTTKVIKNEKFEKMYSTQSSDELKNSIEKEGLKDPLKVNEDMILIDGYRRLEILNELGIEEVYVIVIDCESTSYWRITLNNYRIKTIEDQIMETREIFKHFPKQQGKRTGEKINRTEEISKLLNNKWRGDHSLNKLEYILDNDLENDVLSKGIFGENWKLDSCYQFLTKNHSTDKEKNYGFTEKLVNGEFNVKEINSFIEDREKMDDYKPTFVIPEKTTLYHENCVKLPELLDNKQEVDTIITSIPYFSLRDYKVGGKSQLGHEKTKEEFCKNISEIFQKLVPTLKETSNVIINIGETYENGVGLGIPFMVRDYISKFTDLTYKDSITWIKPNPKPQSEKVKRPTNSTEYLFWFVINPEKSKYKLLTYPREDNVLKISKGCKDVSSNGKKSKKSKTLSKNYKKIMKHIKEQEVENIISTSIGKNSDILKISKEGHPAPMSPMLPITLILMLTDEHDVVCDPFSGSSVVGKCSIELNRRFIGTELSKEFYQIGCEMLKLGVDNFNREELDQVNRLVYPDQIQENPLRIAA